MVMYSSADSALQQPTLGKQMRPIVPHAFGTSGVKGKAWSEPMQQHIVDPGA